MVQSRTSNHSYGGPFDVAPREQSGAGSTAQSSIWSFPMQGKAQQELPQAWLAHPVPSLAMVLAAQRIRNPGPVAEASKQPRNALDAVC